MKETKELLEKKYPIGTEVELIRMNDIQAPPKGTKGKVTYIDDACQIHVSWATGSTIALNPDEDEFMVLDRPVLFVDMDGTVARWQDVSLEEVTKEGYFTSLQPHENVIEAIRLLIHRGVRVKILSSVFVDDHSKAEKFEWLDRYMPFIPAKDRIFTPYGSPKGECKEVKEEVRKAFLLDDNSDVLHHWLDDNREGIKILNGVNGTKGTWHGYTVRNNMVPTQLANQIYGIMSVAYFRQI